MENPYEPPKSGESTSVGRAGKKRPTYSTRQWVRAIIIFLVVTPVACAVMIFLLFLVGGIVATLISSSLDPNSWFWNAAPAAGVAIGLLLGLRTGLKTAKNTFPLEDNDPHTNAGFGS